MIVPHIPATPHPPCISAPSSGGIVEYPRSGACSTAVRKLPLLDTLIRSVRSQKWNNLLLTKEYTLGSGAGHDLIAATSGRGSGGCRWPGGTPGTIYSSMRVPLEDTVPTSLQLYQSIYLPRLSFLRYLSVHFPSLFACLLP